ncbi:30S ribosomal protein S9 [Candidatus Dojkabacteria bacterium]|nr:30S ribosomal protein S9 [Candidatus Dojkabacteria bacterium]
MKYFEGRGGRKSSTARVRIQESSDMSIVNEKPLEEYFKDKLSVKKINEVLSISNLQGKVNFTAKVSGSGISSQADAVALGLARAILKYDPEKKSDLRKAGFLTRDSRQTERKKYFFRKARKKPQFSKR